MGAPYIYDISRLKVKDLTLILLTWRKWWAPNKASKQHMGFNSGFKGRMWIFYVLLTVYLDIFVVNNQLDAPFYFMYVYFYSLHISGSHVPIIRRINCINIYQLWAHGCPKHVENRNNHTWKRIVHQVGYLQRLMSIYMYV